ncbi:hypothetical protein LRP88_02236 [Fusarium phalaenopsidis]
MSHNDDQDSDNDKYIDELLETTVVDASTNSRTARKIFSSVAVKEMARRTPGSTATTPALDLSTGTTTYTAVSSSNQTTNDLTRQKNPESRPWKVSPATTHNGFTRNSILFSSTT